MSLNKPYLDVPGTTIFDELYRDPHGLEQFMGAMTGLSRLNFEVFAEKFDFSPFKTLCDVGGANALLSRTLAALALVTYYSVDWGLRRALPWQPDSPPDDARL